MFLVLMVENFMVDERVFIFECFEAKITKFTDRRLVLVSVVPGEAGLATVRLVTLLAVIRQTWQRKKTKSVKMVFIFFK